MASHDGGINTMRSRSEKAAVILLVVLFAVVLLRTAWVSEDAYITFRTIDNFVHGYGLTWNADERVQVYTHPLWLWLLTGVYVVTGELFYSSMLLSVVVSVAVVVVVGLRAASSTVGGLLAITILTLSRSFVDYSTSGLENPLTHLLLAAFLVVYLSGAVTVRRLFVLALLAALATLNRMDTLLLFLPALIWAGVELRRRQAVAAVALGFVPFLVWECFSLFYYGFLFPNTAYAKLATGIGEGALLKQGLCYVLSSVDMDPLTVVMLAGGVMLPVVTRQWRNLAVAGGMVLYVGYVVSIGGDFMGGRFLTAALLSAVVLLARVDFRPAGLTAGPVFGLAIAVAFASGHNPLASDAGFAYGKRYIVDSRGIADERGCYYQGAGLLKARRNVELPEHDWAKEGRAAREAGPAVVVRPAVGYFGYFAGPQVHVVDRGALGDPLLARLPAADRINWRIGHFWREIPEGYVETLASGHNEIRDLRLAAYYDKLRLVTRGKLWDGARIRAIWDLNVGAAGRLLEAYREAHMGRV
jgi:arabinofuranosyltransferase